MKHGKSGAWRSGCRCELCTTGHDEAATDSFYINGRCRCDICRQKHREAMVGYKGEPRRERDKAVVEAIRAGTETLSVIGRRFGLSRERIRQIGHNFIPDFSIWDRMNFDVFRVT